MTMSHEEQTRRAIVKAAREVASFDASLFGDAEIIEAVEEHIGWAFDADERRVAMAAYREAQA